MADDPNQDPSSIPSDDVQLPEGVPVDGEDDAPEAPRRAASAQFIVDARVGSDVALREAMDPANQSLADALRLSYRVLQVVILVLVVLFIFSGWKRVQVEETGVLTVWGRIVEVSGNEALSAGLKFSKWPYPAGEFILFKEMNRPFDLSQTFPSGATKRAFWPAYKRQQTFEQAVAASTIQDRLKPGRDGSAITRDAELAHLQVSGSYDIADPVRFISRLSERDANRLVQLAVERATVHHIATLGIQDVTDRTESLASAIRADAQKTLNRIDCGILIQTMQVPRATSPFPIIKTMENLSQTIETVNEGLVRARNQANETLTAVAGKRYEELGALIDEYELLIATDDAATETKLEAIYTLMEDPATTGEVARIVNLAQSYQSQVESTLGNEARRFTGMLPMYRRQPEMVIKRLWFEARARVLSRDDAEIFYVPATLASLKLNITGLDDVADRRRKTQLDLKERKHLRQFTNPMGYGSKIIRADDVRLQGPGRQLKVGEDDKVKALGDDR